MGINLIDLNQIFPMKLSEFEKSLSVESCKKNAENYQNGYVAEKFVVSKL